MSFLGQVLRVAGTAFMSGLMGRRLRRILWGAVLLLIGGVIATVGLVLLISSLFFYLAEVSNFVTPAIIAGVISLLLAGLSFVESFRLMKY